MQNPFITSTQEGFNFVKYAKNLTEVLGKGAGDALHRSLSGDQTDMVTSLIDAHKDVVAANGIDATIDVVAKLITKSHYTEPTIYFSMLLIADLYITALLNQKTLSECKENPHVLNEELKAYAANPIPIIKEKESLTHRNASPARQFSLAHFTSIRKACRLMSMESRHVDIINEALFWLYPYFENEVEFTPHVFGHRLIACDFDYLRKHWSGDEPFEQLIPRLTTIYNTLAVSAQESKQAESFPLTTQYLKDKHISNSNINIYLSLLMSVPLEDHHLRDMLLNSFEMNFSAADHNDAYKFATSHLAACKPDDVSVGKYVGPVSLYGLAKDLYGDVIASQIMEIGDRAVNLNEVDESPYYILDGLMSVDTPAYNTLSAVRKHHLGLFKDGMTRIRSLTKGLDLIYEASSYRELLYSKLLNAGFNRTDANRVLVIVSDITGIGFAGKHHLGISPDEIVAGIVAGPTSDAFVFVHETFRKYHLSTDNEFEAMWDSLLRYGPQHTNER